jgi:hypothetical protein
MSKQLQGKLKKSERPTVWCLPKNEWDNMAGHLLAAEDMFKKAVEVTPEEWQEWTSEFGESQGFPSIIYHDKPIIIRPPETPIQG